MKVIGIVGKQGSGKNTLASFLSSEGKLHPMAFADPLKKVVQELFGLKREELWGPSEARSPRTREILQTLGTDFVKKYDPKLWMHKMNFRLEYFRVTGKDDTMGGYTDLANKGVIVTDVRFPEEAAWLRQRFDAALIKIVRPGMWSSPGSDHICETAMDAIPEEHFTTVVRNDGTLDDLKNKALEFLNGQT
jgi:hypothetical protein